MTEWEPPERTERKLVKTHDERYEYMGYWRFSGVCRLRIYEGADQVPVVVASELPDNEGTSITNLAEYLAAQVIARYFPQRFEANDVVRWIEHYPRSPEERRRGLPEFSRVEFASTAPHITYLGGIKRITLGHPTWTYLEPEAVITLLGELPD